MRDDAISVSLDLEGFRVVETIEVDDAVTAVIETVVAAGCCPRCGHATLEGKGRRRRMLRDLPVRGKPLWLRWIRRCFRCRVCGHRFVERHESVPPRLGATPRFERYLYERSRPGLVPLAHVARCEQVSFYRVQRAHSRGAAGELDRQTEPPAIRVLAVDEASFKRRHVYNTVISDPERGRPLELVSGRDGVGLAVWAGLLPDHVRDGVETFVADLWAPYHEVAKAAFPNARRVADKFHIVRMANHALTLVRRDAQRTRRGRHHRTRPFGSRFLLLRAGETLNPDQRAALAEVFLTYPELRAGWDLKEELRQIYRIRSPQHARRRLRRWRQRCQSSGLRSFIDLAATIVRWETEILNYFHDRQTNAFAEGVTNKIKCIKRVAFGYRNFERYRERVLVACL